MADATEPALQWQEVTLPVLTGQVTTVNLLGDALRWVLDDPEPAQRLRIRPEPIPGRSSHAAMVLG
ncbi:hypothetical protein [Pseudonocardia sp. MH-G8]|uniref:hypothetical protein n=1 Tax=Pseudonocardia sp. MH-G8 TaxID=1854588 RepID=UPI000BA112EF|nr:hypothetical protein [Pseudonocardia sp. MH-G8]OZM79167.1 hypothetical protein CFP66_28035 [Pseudonocardia sp. MH-G8]